ncbi:tail fiber protein [uncultured Rikenella sp.]|uniref:tail fiber protein n=1 Tax=uncultured Rikenella sp. TaxID=368003 RepID=UPI0025EC04A8|nr:tail fiber protein [uncultured Rikenella sp.]
MKQTIGRFLLQPNKNFPVDCETLDALQTNIALLQVLGNLAGDKSILSGCEPELNNTRRRAGYVFLKTNDFPEGEVIYWEGGNIAGGMYVHQEIIPVTAQGYEFPQAYTVRSLKPGIGSENYDWADFHAVKTPPELEAEIRRQDIAIEKLAPPPLGIVQLWSGKTVPKGYELCEGQQLKITDYPELYQALGTTFNNTYSATGLRYATSNGYFRLPDLRGRFVVGYNPNDTDYNTFGNIGGEKQHTLTSTEMPSHTHQVKDYYFSEAHNDPARDGRDYFPNPSLGSGKSDSDNHYLYYLRHHTESTGSNAAHENRPPYYVLAYIMRVK